MARTAKRKSQTTPRKIGGVQSKSIKKAKKKSTENLTKKKLVSSSTKSLRVNMKREALTPLTNKNNSDTKKKRELMSDDNEEDMSEYELVRLKNIRERDVMFGELMSTKSRLSSVLTPSRKEKSAASRRGLITVKKEKEILPPRKSARIAGGKVPEIERYAPELQPEEEHGGLPLETLKLKETFKHGEEESKVAQMEQFCSDFSANIGVDEKNNSFGSSEQYSKRFSKLRLTAERVAKVVPDRIFSMAVHPSAHKVLVAAGGKWGGVGLWDVEDTDSEENGVYLFTPHARPINFLSWDRFNHNNLITTSYDGTCRITDIQNMEHRLLYGDEKFLDLGGAYTTFHSQIDANTFLVAKGRTGLIGLVDIRSGYESTVQEFHVFERVSAKSLEVHPVQANLFLTANNKAGVYIFDIRHQGKKHLMEPVCELTGHTKSVSSATFSPVTGNKVLTVCWDDKLRLFDTQKMSGELQAVGKPTKHNNQTGRWLTPFKAHWHARHDDLVLTGSMARPREIEAWRAGTALERIHSFQGEELGSICSIVATHPSRDIVVGGNSSGRVHVFM